MLPKTLRRKGAKSNIASDPRRKKVLEMMEDQDIPVGSGNRYYYLPVRKDDRAAKTGRPKYLPLDTS